MNGKDLKNKFPKQHHVRKNAKKTKKRTNAAAILFGVHKSVSRKPFQNVSMESSHDNTSNWLGVLIPLDVEGDWWEEVCYSQWQSSNELRQNLPIPLFCFMVKGRWRVLGGGGMMVLTL